MPGKVLRPVGGRLLLDHVLDRVSRLQHLVTTVVATSGSVADGAIAAFCASRETHCYRGDEHDVLARYYHCARAHGFGQIVRLTADNPFTDVDELDRLIDLQLAGDHDFSCSFEQLPVGVGAEIFSFAALERSHREGLERHHREHVDEYVLEHPDRFRIGRLDVPPGKRHPGVRLTVDTPADLRRADYVASCVPGLVTTEKAIELCSRYA